MFTTDPDPSRLKLHVILVALLGSNNVYYQPPSTLKMQYPCIVYEQDALDRSFADNVPYRSTKRYQVTIIDRNPDSLISEKVSALPLSAFVRRFTNDQLNHTIYTLYF